MRKDDDEDGEDDDDDDDDAVYTILNLMIIIKRVIRMKVMVGIFIIFNIMFEDDNTLNYLRLKILITI